MPCGCTQTEAYELVTGERFMRARPTLVLIPGAGSSAWYWHRVAPKLEDTGFEAIGVDLPAGDDSAGLGEYTQTVVEAIGDVGSVVLVAQSRSDWDWRRRLCRVVT
jgi:hypothetical protein